MAAGIQNVINFRRKRKNCGKIAPMTPKSGKFEPKVPSRLDSMQHVLSRSVFLRPMVGSLFSCNELPEVFSSITETQNLIRVKLKMPKYLYMTFQTEVSLLGLWT